MTTDSALAYANPDYGLVESITGGAHNADHVDLIIVETPPMDVAILADGSGSMPQELSGMKNGLNNLADYILGQTIGKMSLGILEGGNGCSRDCNKYSQPRDEYQVTALCSFGYRGQAGTCGAGQAEPWALGASVDNSFKNLTADFKLASSSSVPEYWMYAAVMSKVIELSSSSDPAYNKMIILITDTVPNGTGMTNYVNKFGGAKNANAIGTAIGTLAASSRIRIYVIQSTRVDPLRLYDLMWSLPEL